MKSAVAIVVEGCITKPVGGAPLTEGLLLYQALCELCAVILIAGETPKDELDAWLLLNGLYRHAQVIYPDGVDREAQGRNYRVWQVNKVRAMGYALEFVVEPDPANVAALLREGYSCMNFLHAQYSVPDWRPDSDMKIRTWDTLASQVATQARLRNEDNRLRWDE